MLYNFHFSDERNALKIMSNSNLIVLNNYFYKRSMNDKQPESVCTYIVSKMYYI